MRVLFVSAEVAPWSRTGGLGEVCAALPAALARRGHRVVTCSPRYALGTEAPARDAGVAFDFWLFGHMHRVRWRVHQAGERLAHVFLEHPALARPTIYGRPGAPWPDNLLRFALLCRSAWELARRVPVGGGPLGEDLVVHAHDWHAALAPVYALALYRPLALFAGARTVLTLHNAAHQGASALEAFGGLDLAPRHLGTLEWNGALNPLKGGIEAADALTTVSPTHAWELTTPEGGFGLHPVLARKAAEGRFAGILNGLDTEAWNPAADPHLPAAYDAEDLRGRAACRRALLEELDLPADPGDPVLAYVGRLAHQKGVDLLLAVADEVLAWGVRLVVLGTGAPDLEAALHALARRHPDRVRVRTAFDVPLSHRILAGADLLAVPSRFEPCGLVQLAGMRYGAVPVVHATGGLRDTVEPWSPDRGEGTGWTFAPARPEPLRSALGHAVRTFREWPDAFARVRRNGMRRDWSWDRAAARYEAIYRGGTP